MAALPVSFDLMSGKWPLVILLCAFGTCLLAVPLFIFSRVDKDRIAVMGMWSGGFYVDEAEALRGYLQLYRGKDRFKMRLGSKDQEIEFEGTWKVKGSRIELRANDIKFQNPSVADQKSLGLLVLDSEKVRAAYAKPITLDLKGQELVGLTITLDKFQGKHLFRKGEVTPNTQRALDQIKNKR